MARNLAVWDAVDQENYDVMTQTDFGSLRIEREVGFGRCPAVVDEVPCDQPNVRVISRRAKPWLILCEAHAARLCNTAKDVRMGVSLPPAVAETLPEGVKQYTSILALPPVVPDGHRVSMFVPMSLFASDPGPWYRCSCGVEVTESERPFGADHHAWFQQALRDRHASKGESGGG